MKVTSTYQEEASEANHRTGGVDQRKLVIPRDQIQYTKSNRLQKALFLNFPH